MRLRPTGLAMAALTVVAVLAGCTTSATTLRAPSTTTQANSASTVHQSGSTVTPPPFTATGLPSVRPGVASGNADVKWLRAARWTALAPAPIPARQRAVTVWTGSRLLVWGGMQQTAAWPVAFADGASYDPTADRWELLPTSPLTARSQVAAVWTGQVLFVWGGVDGKGEPRTDGATYDPGNRTWTVVPAPPIPQRGDPAVAAVGGDVVFVADSTGSTGSIAAAVFRVASRTWVRAATVPALASYHAVFPTLTTMGTTVALLAQTESESFVQAQQLFVYDPTADRWTVVAAKGQPSIDMPAIWTGDGLLLPLAPRWCGGGGHSCGPPDSHAARLATGASAWTALPEPREFAQCGLPVWTGGALLCAVPSPPPDHLLAWSPGDKSWTAVPGVPPAVQNLTGVWTGHAALFWGTNSDGTTAGYRLSAPRQPK